MLRSVQEIMGLAVLRHESQRHNIITGNKCLKVTVSMALCALRQIVPFSIDSIHAPHLAYPLDVLVAEAPQRIIDQS